MNKKFIIEYKSNKLTELYLHVPIPVNGENAYFSFQVTDDGTRPANRVYMYINTGFDDAQAVDAQPGRLSGATGTETFSWTASPYYAPYCKTCNRLGFVEELVVVNDVSIMVHQQGITYGAIKAYFGAYTLHFSMANSGTFFASNASATYSQYYFRYGNIWYGDGVGNASADGYQGRWDVDKAPYSYNYQHTPFNNIELYKQTLWINDDNVQADTSFSCVGYIDTDVCYNSNHTPKVFNSDGKLFAVIPFGGYNVVSSKGIYIEL